MPPVSGRFQHGRQDGVEGLYMARELLRHKAVGTTKLFSHALTLLPYRTRTAVGLDGCRTPAKANPWNAL